VSESAVELNASDLNSIAGHDGRRGPARRARRPKLYFFPSDASAMTLSHRRAGSTRSARHERRVVTA
jgi:hypothetical protein